MKKALSLVITLVVSVIIFSAFITIDIHKEKVFLKEVTSIHKTDFKEFQKEVNTLNKLAESIESESDYEQLKTQVASTRLAYKAIEFIFDYYQTNYSGAYINGAPLPKVSENYSTGKALEPSGLQTLDEAVYEDYSEEALEYLQYLTKELKTRVDFVEKIHFPTDFKTSQIIECLRSGIVRIFNLGLTGFDTPGSVNAIEESYVSLLNMEKTFLKFKSITSSDAKQKFKEVKKIFAKGKRFLKKDTDFDTFDRMTFLKEVVNPLYKKLAEYQELNKTKLLPFKSHAQNYKARNLFDPNFLSTDFYSYFVYLPFDNPKTIALGKKLFNDKRLSGDNKMSCATCHNPNLGFSDGLAKSITNKPGVFTKRNSPTLINIGYSKRFFWDMRAHDLERQVGHVIDNKLEFNTSFKTIAKKLEKDSNYRKLFAEAYEGISKNDINQRSISNAIAAYVNSLQSFNSEFDKYVRNEVDTYPEEAKRGFNLFMGKAACGTCHFAPVFNGTIPPFYLDSESEVLGVTKSFDTINPQLDDDLGRMDNGLYLDKQEFFKHSFKTVTIRNVSETAPYMHNGAFKTLEEVLEFYNRGGGVGMGVEIGNQTLPDASLNLSQQEMQEIIAFMNTLTDVKDFLEYAD